MDYNSKYKGAVIDALLDEVAAVPNTYAPKNGSANNDFSVKALSIAGDINMKSGCFTVTDHVGLSYNQNFNVDEDGNVTCGEIECSDITCDGKLGVSEEAYINGDTAIGGDLSIAYGAEIGDKVTAHGGIDIDATKKLRIYGDVTSGFDFVAYSSRSGDNFRGVSIIDDEASLRVDIPVPASANDRVLMASEIPHIKFDGFAAPGTTIESSPTSAKALYAYWFEDEQCLVFRAVGEITPKYYYRTSDAGNYGNISNGKVTPFAGKMYITNGTIYFWSGHSLVTPDQLPFIGISGTTLTIK